jgi:23S rRNA (adenine2503-C2)-methyltransferase
VQNIYDLPLDRLKKIFQENGLNASGPSLLFNYLYKKLEPTFSPENLSKSSQDFLKENYSFALPRISKVQKVEEGEKVTRKFLVLFEDNLEVECVLIPFQDKFTLCLSSQVGCGMACSFCYTGTQGLSRNLKTSEIVGQLMAVKYWLKEAGEELKISNLVFMGQGEPLHNFEAVRSACEIFLSQNGLSFGREKITISTAGYLPGLKEWSADPLKVNLALSFHCPEDKVRSELIPLNKAFPLKDILDEIRKIPLEKKRFVTFEVLLIDQLNDSIAMAKKTAEMLKDISPLVNIIPFNPIPGSPYRRPKDDVVEQYKEIVESYGIPTMVRRTKGDDILAACGQLKS